MVRQLHTDTGSTVDTAQEELFTLARTFVDDLGGGT
jgi:hypothetical protein